MSQVINSAAPVTKGFVYETPKGTKRFVAHVLFDDRAVRGVHDDFDGKEEVKVSFPIKGSGNWRIGAARFRGTEDNRLDIHSYAATIGAKRGIDLASLFEFGFAASAWIKGARLQRDGGGGAHPDKEDGGQFIELQHPGENARVYDVGKVDERGIAWTSKVFANSSYGDRDVRTEIKDGDTIRYDKNVRFEVDVFAPGYTPRGNVSPEEQKKILKRLGISIETDFLPPGYRHRLLKYFGNVGSDGNDMRLGWELADPSNFKNKNQPEPGIYPVRIMKGKEVLASFNLDWR
jgi:hypothetical protein